MGVNCTINASKRRSGRRWILTAVLAVSQLLVACWGQAEEGEQASLHFTLNDILELEYAEDPQISPDGEHIVYARMSIDQMHDTRISRLWILRKDGSEHRFLAEGFSPRWSPDGSRIAYLSAEENGVPQIYVRVLGEEGSPKKITSVERAPQSISWSPDGETIAFRMRVPETEERWKIDLPQPPEGAVWQASPRIIDNLHEKFDGYGFLEQGFTHLFFVSAAGGDSRQVTSGPWEFGVMQYNGVPRKEYYSWSPDGQFIYFNGLLDKDRDFNSDESYIYKLELKTGKIERLFSEKGFWAQPTPSPDGRYLAFVGHRYSRKTTFSYEIWRSKSDGSDLKKISGDLFGNVQNLHWSPREPVVYFTMNLRGTEQLYSADLKGNVESLTQGDHNISLGAISQDGVISATLTTAHMPAQVGFIETEADELDFNKLTHLSGEVLDQRSLAEIKEINYLSTDGTEIQGWVVTPPDFNAEKRYPMILAIHGGPHWFYDVGFSEKFQYLASQGYVVLFTNPRGSTGYGRKFTEAIHNQYPGKGDYQDLMSGVDYLVNEEGYVDDERLFVYGCSGGGILTSWLLTQTNRFKAGAAFCTVSNWISLVGTADAVTWVTRLFDKPYWEDPSAWLEHSPLMHVDKINTPLLLATGELDMRTPIAQAEELYTALKLRGVPTRLIRFGNEYHGTDRVPSNALRTLLYLTDWFRQWDVPADDDNAQ